MKFKDNTVVWRDFTPDCWFAIVIAAEIYTKYGIELVITSGKDGKHKDDSLHYRGNAFDCRTYTLSGEDLPKVANTLKAKLGINYDVVIEKDHIHVEYDKKI